jgi:hypothetical protein
VEVQVLSSALSTGEKIAGEHRRSPPASPLSDTLRLLVGEPQSADIPLFVSIVNGKPSPDFPRGWGITMDHGVAILVEESSGLYGDPSCLTNVATLRLINS